MTRTIPLSPDWYGQDSAHDCRFALNPVDRGLRLILEVHKSAYLPQRHQAGDFVEGLWTQDVAELFVATGSSSYREFNFSPTGAWWAAQFRDYRDLERSLPDVRPEISTSLTLDSWRVDVLLPTKSLGTELEEDPCSLRVKVCSILYTSPSVPPTYLCSTSPTQGPPDFHRLEDFRELRVFI